MIKNYKMKVKNKPFYNWMIKNKLMIIINKLIIITKIKLKQNNKK